MGHLILIRFLLDNAISNDGKYFSMGISSVSKLIRVYDMTTNKMIPNINTETDSYFININDDGKILATGDN